MPITVLNVDDNDASRYAVTRILRHEGFDVLEAATGGEALRLIRANPDVVLLDVHLPDASGLDICRRLKADPETASLPVLHISATCIDTQDRVNGLMGGADGYLAGPVEPAELIASIRALLRVRQAEEAARAAERRLQSVLEGITDGFVSVDREWRFVEVNRQVEAVFGKSREELIGKVMWEEFPAAVESDFYGHYHRAVAEGAPVHFEARSALTPRWFEAHAYPSEAGLSIYLRDITERKELEERLRQRAAELTEADRRKDEFLAMLGHELRNPLGVISNAALLLGQMPAADETIARLRSTISRQSQHLARLVDDLLDVSRITRGRVELRKEVIDLAPVLKRAVASCQPELTQRQHTLTVTMPPGPILLDADPARLEQMITNLLNNASKYTDPGGRIELSAGAEGDEAVIRVRDNGIGIAPEFLPHVFELFVQTDRALDRAQGGLGIGLSLVRRLAQLHGGSVTAHSPGPGQGSEFVIRLPLARTDRIPCGAGAAGAPATPPRRVLIVDDDPDACSTLGDILERWGHAVDAAHDGRTALHKAAERLPDVVLLDIGLPGMDGYEVARRLRAEHPRAPMRIVALTGYGQEESRQRSHAAGFDLHLTKPADLGRIRQLLAEAAPPEE